MSTSGGSGSGSAASSGIFSAVNYPGASDDVKAQAALDACVAAGGGVVELPAGVTLNWTTSPLQIVAGYTGMVTIRGAGIGATVKLSSGCPRFADFHRTADGNTFQNLVIENLTIDANNIGGKHHVVIGGWIAGTTLARCNITNVRVRKIRVINCPAGTDASTDFRIGIALYVKNNPGDTQNYVTNCRIEDVELDGCMQGIAVTAAYYTDANHLCNVWIDDVHIARIRHDIPGGPAAGQSSGCHVIVGGRGRGGWVTVSEVRGSNSSDVGIEIDSIQNCSVTDCDIKDSWTHGYYHTQFEIPLDAASQLITWVRCRHTRSAAQTANAAGITGLGWRASAHTLDDAVTVVQPSNMILRDCSYLNQALLFNAAEAFDFSGIEHLTIDGFMANIEYGSYTDATPVTSSAARIVSGSSSVRTKLRVRNLAVFYAGSKDGTGTINHTGLILGSSNLIDFDVDTARIVSSITLGTFTGIVIGSSAAFPTVQGVLRHPEIECAGTSSSVGIDIGDIAHTTLDLTIEDPDFTRCQTTTTELNTRDNGAAVKLLRPRWRNAHSPYWQRADLVSGDKTLNNTGWTTVDTNLDLTLFAKIGDLLEVGGSGFLANNNVWVALDVVTVVSGSVVNSLSNGTTTPPLDGLQAWQAPPSAYSKFGSSIFYVVQSTDIDGLTVKLRLRFKSLTAVNRTLSCNTNDPLSMWARNHGVLTGALT